ncbi:MAG TPA: hypothetical protein VGR81_07815 [Candidatus Acidoferrales bacterium]|nr:hypothetical protein [Candidatus Acidoferrales bacterium]
MFCAAVSLCASCSHQQTNLDNSWNHRAAAAYLDERETTWMTYPHAARDRGTFCVSCHTAMPYALSRQAIDTAYGLSAPTLDERKLIDNVRTRVNLWKEIQPYYPSQAPASRGTEAVLNTLILASNDARTGKLSADTRAAFGEMWSLQETAGSLRGAWQWIEFNNEPWEAYDSAFYGATLAAVATGLAPENYRSAPEIQANLQALRDYFSREAAAQTLLNRVSLLWASAEIPGILTAQQQESIVNEILAKQQADGGWSASSLVGTWKRADKTPLVTKSDGYATGLIVYALEQTGLGHDNPHVKDGLDWLVQNQHWSGRWDGYSLNRRRLNPFSNPSGFMDDAATAYAVLALTSAQTKTGEKAALQTILNAPTARHAGNPAGSIP